MNSPASSDFDKADNVYFTSPNFHNDTQLKSGAMKKAAAPTIGKIDKNNQLTTWYTFKPEDLELTSGKVAPMGIGFSPDSNAYVADMQLWFGGQSRILRINVENGKAIDVDVDVVATGISFPNAAVFKSDDLSLINSIAFIYLDDNNQVGQLKMPEVIQSLQAPDLFNRSIIFTY